MLATLVVELLAAQGAPFDQHFQVDLRLPVAQLEEVALADGDRDRGLERDARAAQVEQGQIANPLEAALDARNGETAVPAAFVLFDRQRSISPRGRQRLSHIR